MEQDGRESRLMIDVTMFVTARTNDTRRCSIPIPKTKDSMVLMDRDNSIFMLRRLEDNSP